MVNKIFTDESLTKFVDKIKAYVDNAISTKANISHTHSITNITNLQSLLNGKASSTHTHSYAASSSDGGAATSADKLNANAGSTVQPVYFEDGIPKATAYTLEKSVPSDAKFTDTTYSPATLGRGYGTCATATATTAKVVTLSNYSLKTGGIVAVKFDNSVPANATMNINSNGAKAIFYKGKTIVDGVICAGEVATFIYDGTQYHLLTVDRNRLLVSLVPYGASIAASETATVDINTMEYLKVGNYYCTTNVQAGYISNLPRASVAFMMTVYSPLSQVIDNETGAWIYRIRKIMYYDGVEYIQYCDSNGSGVWNYGAWNKIMKSSDIATTSTAGLMSANDKTKLDGLESRIAALEKILTENNILVING